MLSRSVSHDPLGSEYSPGTNCSVFTYDIQGVDSQVYTSKYASNIMWLNTLTIFNVYFEKTK